MIGIRPGVYWRVCWKFVAPIFLLFIIVYGLIGYEPLRYEEYVYPDWANMLGWSIAGSSMAMIPAMAIYQIIVTPGSFKQVCCCSIWEQFQFFKNIFFNSRKKNKPHRSSTNLNTNIFSSSYLSIIKRLRTLTTPWRDQQNNTANGSTIDSVQVRLTTAKDAEDVWGRPCTRFTIYYVWIENKFIACCIIIFKWDEIRCLSSVVCTVLFLTVSCESLNFCYWQKN